MFSEKAKKLYLRMIGDYEEKGMPYDIWCVSYYVYQFVDLDRNPYEYTVHDVILKALYEAGFSIEEAIAHVKTYKYINTTPMYRIKKFENANVVFDLDSEKSKSLTAAQWDALVVEFPALLDEKLVSYFTDEITSIDCSDLKRTSL